MKKRPPPLGLATSTGNMKNKPPPLTIGLATTSNNFSNTKKKETFEKSKPISNSPTNAENDDLQFSSPSGGTLELIHTDFEVLGEIGRGSSGVVEKVLHKPTNKIMARKMIRLEVKPAIRKQICTELKVLHECNSEHVVGFFGSYVIDQNVAMCMEYMDGGSLDYIYVRMEKLPEDILCKIVFALISALDDLQENHKILHRDVKPSNVLLNTNGDIKMCDFGVSGELINSQVDSFVGTRSYMAPERLAGAAYSVKSDVWSLGMSILEIALGRFPIPPIDDEDNANPQPPVRLAFLELLQYIVNEEPPQLPSSKFSEDACDFVRLTLLKDATARHSPTELLNHPWMQRAKEMDIDMGKFVTEALKRPAPCINNDD